MKGVRCQTGKINQGNGALKRVVEAIANGHDHIPYRDSKLTMILQVWQHTAHHFYKID